MADVRKILIEIDAKTGNVVGGIGQVNKQLDALGTKAKLATKEISAAAKAMQKDMAGSAGIAGAAATELGRTISDLPFGLTAVTNNISQLGNMFALLVTSTNSVGGALKALWSTLMGPVGILVAFQAAVAGLELFAQAQRKAEAETKKTEKSIKDLNASLLDQQILFNQLSELAYGYSEDIAEVFAKNVKEVGKYFEEVQKEGTLTREIYDEGIRQGRILIQSRIDQNDAQQRLLDVSKRLREEQDREIPRSLEIKKLNTEQADARRALNEAINREVAALKILNYEATEEVVVTAKIKKEKKEEVEIRERSIASLTREALVTVKSFRNAYIQKRMLQERERRDDEGFLEWKIEFFSRLSEDESFSFEERTAYYRQYVIATQQLGDLQLRNEQTRLRAMEQINLSYADSLGTIFNTISELAGENRFIQAIALLGESASGIAKIVISTKAANAAAKLKYALIPGGQALAAAEIAANNLGAKVGIAANVASTAMAISKLKAPVAAPSAPGLATESTPAEVAAPAFNVVGATTQNQLAAAILGSQQEPMRAYVVSSDVTTAQQLERNIVQGASI